MKRAAVTRTIGILMGVLTIAPFWAGTPTKARSITGTDLNRQNRAYLQSTLERDAVESALRSRGIDPTEVKVRLAKLPQEKIDRLAMRLRKTENNDTDPLHQEKQAMGEAGNSLVGAVVSVITTIIMIPINIITAILTGF